MPALAFAFRREQRGDNAWKWNSSETVVFHATGYLDNCVSICCPINCEALTISTQDWPANPAFSSCWCSSHYEEGWRLIEVQCYLRCRAAGIAPPAEMSRAWEIFYRRYRPLVHRQVMRIGRFVNSGKDPCDLQQEVWSEIVSRLPRLAYRPGRGSVASWLATVARRKILQLMSRPGSSLQITQSLDGLEASIPSVSPGPADCLELKEIHGKLYATLAELGNRTSRANYEIFHRRILQGQSVDEVATALNMTPHEVRCRQHRVQRKWRQLAKYIVQP